MRIGILGGGFNPPHYGHLLVAQQVLDFLRLDEVWLMPAFSHPFNKELLAPEIRLQMTRLLETDKIKVTDFELKQNKVSYTYDTLESLSKEYPDHEFYFIIGEDQLKVFDKWKNWQALINKYKFAVFPREADIDKLESIIKGFFPDQTNFIPVSSKNIVTTNISSSKIRRRIQNGESIKYLVPNRVEKYILKNHLYE